MIYTILIFFLPRYPLFMVHVTALSEHHRATTVKQRLVSHLPLNVLRVPVLRKSIRYWNLISTVLVLE